MQDSHTAAPAAETTATSSPLRLVGASMAGLPEWLAGRVDEHLAAFAAHMTQGLLAASTAVGLGGHGRAAGAGGDRAGRAEGPA